MRFKRFLRVFLAACVLGLLAAVFPLSQVLASAAVGVTPSTIAPGGTVYVNGSGFPTVQAVVISWQYGANTAITTDGTGAFYSAPLTVPPGTPAGNYPVSVTVGTTTAFGSFSVVITTTFALSAATGYVGDSVTVTGSGFTASSPVTFTWDGVTTLTTSPAVITADVNGAIPAGSSIIIPAAARGAHTVNSSPASAASRSFSVLSKLVVNPTSGGTGTPVIVTGTGFAASVDEALAVDSVTLQGTTPPSIFTNASGSFSGSFSIPSAANGSHTVSASDTGGGASAPFSVVPTISLSSTSGIVGINVLIYGSGFSAGSPLTVSFETTSGSGVFATVATIPAAPTADSLGAFTSSPISMAIPAVGGGAHKVKVTDQSGNSAVTTLTVLPTMSISPISGTAGTQVTVTGSGFAPSLGVNIFWDTTALTTNPATVTASSTGAISATFVSPPSAWGSHTVKAQDTSGNSASATFSTKPKITLTPASGGYGDTITITFSGFTANGTVTSVQLLSGNTTYNLTTTPPTIPIDANGNGTASFSVINVYNGSWTVQAADINGSAQATLAVTQKVNLNVATGAAGDVITVTGTGFANNKAVTFKYNGVALATTPASVTSDGNGAFACQFAVPSTPAGAIPLVVSDGNNSATATFTATDKATISTVTTQSNPGYVGMPLTVSGTGFLANSTITVTFASAPVTVATVTSDANGAFTASFKVPAAPAGNHTISASDGTTTENFTFVMSSTPPAVPALSTPLTKAKPGQPVAFTWGAVTDPSGVTYSIEISQDANFATVLVEHTGLTTTSYTMTALEKLKSAGSNTPYYWRVQATDAAGNASDWSAANTFTIGFIWPWWLIHVWYGLGIIAALILGLWLGRRMAYQSY